MKLLKKQHFIFIDSIPDLGVESFSIKFTSDLKSALREWGATSRISPIWQLRPTIAEPPSQDAEIEEAIALWFLYGVSADFLRDELAPTDLVKLYHDSMWLTLGAFSIILVCRDEELDMVLRDLCTARHIAYERWDIANSTGHLEFSGNTIQVIDPTDFTSEGAQPKSGLVANAFQHAGIESDDALGFMQLELYALLSVIETRAKGPFSVLSSDALRIERLASELVYDHGYVEVSEPSEPVDGKFKKPDVLLTLNAGLSNLTSQALSGASPILRTECHFWPHSLLGIGVASLALRNVTAFVSGLMSQMRYDQRVYSLRIKGFNIQDFDILKFNERHSDLLSIDPNQIVMSRHLDEVDISLSSDDGNEPQVPTPITYFSSLDGFMNGILTTSAPIPSVSGANSYQWNLGTITHEISHRILSGHIVDCIDILMRDMGEIQYDNLGSWDEVYHYFKKCPSNYFDLAASLIGNTIFLISTRDYDVRELKSALACPADFFYSACENHSEEIEELLVHVFDFFHFYGCDSKKYCDFIWLSWAVQPSIEKKLLDYVKRTLTALSVKHIERENWKELAIADFKTILADEPLRSRMHLRIEVEGLLDDEDEIEDILTYLDIARNLLVLFHLYFKMDSLQVEASRELYSDPDVRTLTNKGEAEIRRFNYKYLNGEFIDDRFAEDGRRNPTRARPKFSNPLVFLRDFSRDEQPNAARSAWLLHMLAFNVDFEGSIGEQPV